MKGWIIMMGMVLVFGSAESGELYNPGAPIPLDMATIKAPDSAPVPRWLQTTFRRSHLAGPNYEEIQAHIDAGAQLIIANLDDVFRQIGIFAADTPKELYENSDRRLREFVSYIHERGVRAGAYCGPVHTTYWRKDLALKHPEWLRVGANGKPAFPTAPGQEDRGVQSCTYSPYGDLLIEHLSTLAGDYDLDALWFDGNDFPLHCLCNGCKDAFRKATGEELEIITGPPSAPKAQRFLAWRYRNYIGYMNKVTHEVRKVNPDCTLHFNFSSLREWGHKPWFPEYPAMYSMSQDCPGLELWWQIPGDAIHQSIVTQYMRAEVRERPTSVWIQPHGHGIMGVSTPVEILSRFMNAIANGSVPEFVVPTHRRNYVFEVFEAIEEREEYLIDAKWLKWGAMLVSEQTKMYYGTDEPMGRYMECVFGGFKAIQEEHLPVRLITEQDIEDGLLSDYSVLYLPNSACMSEKAVDEIKALVRNGGGLVASQFTSLYDATGNRNEDFALSDVFHASYKGEREYKDREDFAYIVPENDPISDDPAVEMLELRGWETPPDMEHGAIHATGAIAYVDTLEGGTVGAKLRKMRPDEEYDGTPIYIISSYGKGKVVYFAMGLEKHCYNYGDPFARRMIRNALISVAASEPPIEVDAPRMLQTVFYEQKDANRTIIHLLNDHSSWGRHSLYWQEGFGSSLKMHAYPQREEIIPLHNLVSVTVRGKNVKSVYQEPEHINLAMEEFIGGVKVKVPVVALHSMIVIEYTNE